MLIRIVIVVALVLLMVAVVVVVVVVLSSRQLTSLPVICYRSNVDSTCLGLLLLTCEENDALNQDVFQMKY